MPETPSSISVSTKQQRIAGLARMVRAKPITTLSHHLNIDWLKEAFRRTRKDGASGIDGQTADTYATQLEANLKRLLSRVKSGTYRAPPVRRVHIPKGPSSTRPIGIPTFEDKVLQRAIAMLLEPIYESEFYDSSHGFRPKRSPHTALQSFWTQMMGLRGGWVLEVDVRKFFDTLDHQRLREIVAQRVGDGVVLRLIGKWLQAGVMENGQLSWPDAGTPQGGVISPLLANVFLHAVLDEWFEKTVKPRLRGRAFLVRFADDFVIGLASEEDARRVFGVLPLRFEKFGLSVHPEKTRLLPFWPPRRGPDSSGSFSFLGFTHFWSRSIKSGSWVIKRKTAKDRFSRALQRIRLWCKDNRHLKVRQQHALLSAKLRGHFGYYGITGNSVALTRFRHEVAVIWRKWLDRRSQRQSMPWRRFTEMMKRYPFPKPRPIHSVLLAANP